MMMITEKDINYLKKSQAPMMILAIRWIFPAVILLFVILGFLNIALAKKFAAADGLTFNTFIQYWINGIQLHDAYSGMYLKALERWGTALFQLGLALAFFLPIWLFRRAEYQRSRRILHFIESHREQRR